MERSQAALHSRDTGDANNTAMGSATDSELRLRVVQADTSCSSDVWMPGCGRDLGSCAICAWHNVGPKVNDLRMRVAEQGDPAPGWLQVLPKEAVAPRHFALLC